MRLCILLFIGLCVSGALCSPGLLQRLQQLGRRSKPAEKTEMPVLGGNKKQQTKAEETAAQVANSNQKQMSAAAKVDDSDSDVCGGTILLDLKSGKEQTFSSSNFPKPRKDPYACSWNVKLSKSCKRGQVSLKFNEKSRLAGESRCTKGYVRVTPILADSKLCGNLSSLQALKWIVDSEEQRREEIAILMKNIGVNDGKAEGISFTLSGECLQDTTKSNLGPINGGIAASWLSSASRKPGVTVYSRTLPVGKATSATVDIDEIIVTEDEKVALESTTKQSSTTQASTVAKTAAEQTTKAAAAEEKTTKPQKTYVSVGYYLLRRFIIPPEAKKVATSS